MELQPKSRILIIRLSAIGDVARTLSAVSLLRKHYPTATFVWVVEEKAVPILEEDPILDEIIVFPRKKLTQFGRNPLKWPQFYKEWKKFIHKLRSSHFDVALDFHGIFKSGLIAWASGAPKRVGYKASFVKEWNGLFTNVKVPLANARLNRYDRNFQLIRQWIPDQKAEPTPLYIPLKDQEKISAFLSEIHAKHQNGSPKKCVILHPGASKTRKRWPAEQFAKLADGLIETEKVVVILTWGPGEKELAEQVAQLVQNKEQVILSPELSLKQFAELASRTDLFVSTDSGSMHIAAAMGAEQIALFGPTDPQVNNPQNPKATLVFPKAESEPCPEGCRATPCFHQINVEEVLHLSRLKLITQTNT